MNPSYGLSARRDILRNPPGVGGFAGHTASFSEDPSRVVGTSGYSTGQHNPIRIHDDTGSAVDIPRDPTYRPSHFEVAQSWRRDPIVYPDAFSFRLNFSKPLRGVFGIEVMEINVPNVASTAPLHREFLLLNGLLRETSTGSGVFNFDAQPLGKDRSFHTMVAHSANDRFIDRSAAAWDNANNMQLDDYALARLQYDSTKPYQHWERNGWHRTTWFPTNVDRMDGLELSLSDVFGTPYDFAPNEEWSATFQIFCQS